VNEYTGTRRETTYYWQFGKESEKECGEINYEHPRIIMCVVGGKEKSEVARRLDFLPARKQFIRGHVQYYRCADEEFLGWCILFATVDLLPER
jgi:hypothetical protein